MTRKIWLQMTHHSTQKARGPWECQLCKHWLGEERESSCQHVTALLSIISHITAKNINDAVQKKL